MCNDQAILFYAYNEPCGKSAREHIESCAACSREVATIRGISSLYQTRPRRAKFSWAILGLAASFVLLITSPAVVEREWVSGAMLDRSIASIHEQVDDLDSAPDGSIDIQLDSIRARLAELEIETF